MGSAAEYRAIVRRFMLYERGERLLPERFPPRGPDTEQRDCDAVRRSFSIGQAVSGVVVARAPCGAWLDIGVGFPALLLIPDVAGLTPDRYQTGDWCLVGGTQDEQIVLFNDPARRIRV